MDAKLVEVISRMEVISKKHGKELICKKIDDENNIAVFKDSNGNDIELDFELFSEKTYIPLLSDGSDWCKSENISITERNFIMYGKEDPEKYIVDRRNDMSSEKANTMTLSDAKKLINNMLTEMQHNPGIEEMNKDEYENFLHYLGFTPEFISELHDDGLLPTPYSLGNER